MHIAFDLDGTLIPECGEFPCNRVGGLAEKLFAHALRTGARELLRELAAAGHTLTIYTLSDRSPLRLQLWFWLQGIPVKRVITRRTHAQQVPDATRKWPPTFGIELLYDDNLVQVESARRSGCEAVLLTNVERDWTAAIRARCLSQPPQQALA